ncbi:MAG: hypothetical protein ACMXYL_05470 [Candidatus Woesearchaeota archaeon]
MGVFGGSSRDRIYSSYESIDGKLSEIQKRLGQQQDALTGTLAVDIQQLHTKMDYMYAQLTRIAEHGPVEAMPPPREYKPLKTASSDPKILAKLTELDKLSNLDKLNSLDKLEVLSKLSSLTKLDDLDKLDRLSKLDKLERLEELDRLKELDNLAYLKRLDVLNDIKLALPSASSFQKPVQEPVRDLPRMQNDEMALIMESLKKLTMLDRIDRAQQIMLARMGVKKESGPLQDDPKLAEISKRFIELVTVYRDQNRVLRQQNEALQAQLEEFSNDLKDIKSIISGGQQNPPKKKSTKSQL